MSPRKENFVKNIERKRLLGEIFYMKRKFIGEDFYQNVEILEYRNEKL